VSGECRPRWFCPNCTIWYPTEGTGYCPTCDGPLQIAPERLLVMDKANSGQEQVPCLQEQLRHLKGQIHALGEQRRHLMGQARALESWLKKVRQGAADCDRDVSSATSGAIWIPGSRRPNESIIIT